MSNWSDDSKNRKKNLESLEPKDRLGYVDGCVQSLLVVNQSISGWMQWLSNPTKMSKFPEDELKNFYEFLKKFAVNFVDFDIKVTEKDEEIKEKDKPPSVDHFK